MPSRRTVNLVVSADGEAHHGAVVHMIDLAKVEGITKFAINVERVELGRSAVAVVGIHLRRAASRFTRASRSGARVIDHRKRVEATRSRVRRDQEARRAAGEKAASRRRQRSRKRGRWRSRRASAERAACAEARPANAATNLDACRDFGLALRAGSRATACSFRLRAVRLLRRARHAAIEGAWPRRRSRVRAGDGCGEPVTKPSRSAVPQPAIPPKRARRRYQGKVRVELSIRRDRRGHRGRRSRGPRLRARRSGARARRGNATFEPATRCGTPDRTTFMIAMRFAI